LSWRARSQHPPLIVSEPYKHYGRWLLERGDAVAMKILLIESDSGEASRIADGLRDEAVGGFEVRIAGCLSAALQCLSSESFDAILLDLSLPDSSGLATFHALHDESVAKYVPVIVLSGSEDEYISTQAVIAGAQDQVIIGRVNGQALARVLQHAAERQRLVNALVHQRRQTQIAYDKLSTVIEASADGILIVDPKGAIHLANKAAERLFERSADAMASEIFGYPLTDGGCFEIEIVRPGGGIVVVEMRSVAMEWEGEPYYLANLRDMTERKQAEARVAYFATHDPLTGLPNRRLLMDRAERVLATTRRRNHLAALMMIDLDGFKHVNDTRGHNVGDELLREIASRLTMALRDEDTISRIGGDEFVVILPQLSANWETAVQEAEVVASRIRAMLGEAILIDDMPCCIGASIGVAFISRNTPNIDAVLQEADREMYRDKAAGRARRDVSAAYVAAGEPRWGVALGSIIGVQTR
jgi:diguanylate cyclase (GGDEF)-like protein